MTPRRVGLLLGSVPLLALLAALAPAWTYALSLALFGLPHVLVELRYVDERFAARLPRATLATLLLGLAAIVAVRAGVFGSLGGGSARTAAELTIGALLLLVALRGVWPHRTGALAFVAAVALLLGAVLAPAATLVVLALLHNLTPVGFLAERLRGAPRRRTLFACAIVFVAVPALLCTGWIQQQLAPWTMSPWTEGPFASGALDAQLPVFVPRPLLDTAFADRLFAAATYLQCMHYVAVLHVLPRLSGGTQTVGSALRWPSPRSFALTAIVCGGLFSLGFAASFATTRSVYAVLAAFHAWLEIPILALACGLAPRQITAALPEVA